MSKSRWAKTLCALLTILVLAGGCGPVASTDSKGAVEVKVSFWGTPEEIDIITTALSEWQAKHPNIKIIFEHTPYTGYASKVLTRIAGGAAPDIIATEVDYFVTFATKGVLEDLEPYIAADAGAFSKQDFFPQIIDRFTYQEKLLAVPRDIAPFACVFYNKKLFDEAKIPYPTDDWNWSDMLRIARDLTKKDETGRIIQYGFYGWAWRNFIYGNGANFVDDVKNPKKITLADPKAVAGLQFYADLSNLYEVMPTPVAFTNFGMGADRMFAKGQIAMFLSGIWDTPQFRNYNFEWDVAMFPKNAEGKRGFGCGGTGYAILKSAKNKKEAWEVIKALTGPEGQIQFAKKGLAQPARIKVAQSDAWASDNQPPANKKMLNDAIQYAVFSPFHAGWREIEEKYIVPKLDLVFNGKQTAAEAMQELTPVLNGALKQSE